MRRKKKAGRRIDRQSVSQSFVVLRQPYPGWTGTSAHNRHISSFGKNIVFISKDSVRVNRPAKIVYIPSYSYTIAFPRPGIAVSIASRRRWTTL